MDDTIRNGGASSRGRRPRLILLVDPDYQRRIYAAQLVAELGFRVILAADLETAASIIEKQADRLDAVLVSLPRIIGELERAIAAHQPGLPVVDAAGETYSLENLSRLLGPVRNSE